MHSSPCRKALAAEQTLAGQLPGPGEGGGAPVDHAGPAEAEGLQGAAAKPRGAPQPERGQTGGKTSSRQRKCNDHCFASPPAR